jgi:GNAT superfamily N-acetyltransferase
MPNARPVGRAPRVRMRLAPFADEAHLATVRNGVDLHNVAATGRSECATLSLLLEDADGDVLGGILGELWGDWLHVKFVWVDARLRGRGHARRLVAAAERWARERGAIGAYLESFSFQAPEMYRKLGYEEFGVIDDFPPGHSHHFFRKRLARAAVAPRRAGRRSSR